MNSLAFVNGIAYFVGQNILDATVTHAHVAHVKLLWDPPRNRHAQDVAHWTADAPTAAIHSEVVSRSSPSATACYCMCYPLVI